MVLVTVKWNKSVFENVEFDLGQPLTVFKERLLQLTNVPLDRQKLMGKGAWMGFLKDDAELARLNVKDGFVITLMGTADVLAAPQQATTFVEDMNEQEKAKQGVSLPAGLQNLGNTCYMNSTVQCLRYMPELRDVLANIRINDPLAQALKQLFVELDRSGKPVSPVMFLVRLRNFFPQFNEQRQGMYMQQDAEEFYNALTQRIQHDDNVHSFLSLEVEDTLSCNETPEEPITKKKNRVNKLICTIQGTLQSSNPVDHLNDGIRLWLNDHLEKHSNVLNRNALWTKQTRISKLPKYLCVQFMRFFWNATPESADHTGVKCKILRAVTFPEHLDVFEYCTDEVKSVLSVNRQLEDEKEKEHIFSSVPSESTPANANANPNAMDTEDDSDLQAALAMSMGKPVQNIDHVFDQGVSPTFTGQYELHSVVTHKGRSADSGHYISFVRQTPGSRMWFCFNDTVVTEVTTEDIMKLNGGGDRDMAYLVFYRAKDSNKKAA